MAHQSKISLVVDLSKQQLQVHWHWREWALAAPARLNRQSRTSSSLWRTTSVTPM